MNNFGILIALSACIACAACKQEPKISDQTERDEMSLTEIYRSDCNKTIEVDCGEYGNRTIWFNSSRSDYMAADLAKNWTEYWPRIEEAFVSEFRDSTTPEIGSMELFADAWELRVFDGFSESDPMPEGRIILSLIFLIGERQLVPQWDVFLDEGHVSHSQPVW